tara:strand:- start:315 stop:1061 length:747 start_codon:yes stop_codon:yes gene_type:complete
MSLVPTIDFPPSLPEDEIKMAIEDVEEDKEAVEQVVPIVKKKQLIDQDEVFHKPIQKINRPKTPERSRDEPEIILPDPDNKDIPNGRREEDIEPVPKAPKKKRVMSEKQKAHLAKAREKALAKRRANKEIRDKAKAIKDEVRKVKFEKEEKRGAVMEEAKEIIKQKEEETIVMKSDIMDKNNYIQKDDLQEIMYQGIMRYDALRKQRKQEKKIVQHQQRHQQKVLNTIQKANGVPRLGGEYGNCFNFS